MNSASYFLANTYSAFSPALNTASAACSVNGHNVVCPFFVHILGPSIFSVFWIPTIIIFISLWKIFTKAGQPGWASLIPIYNLVIMLQIIKKPTWWIILYFIPIVNIIIALIVVHKLSEAFGKGFLFTLGLVFLPIIFYPILGFGNATYSLPVTQA